MIARIPIWVRMGLAGFAGVLGLFVLIELVTTVLFVVSSRTRWQPGLGFMRSYNRKIGNRLALTLHKNQVAAVHHTGRTSGTEYVTPVWAERVEDSFIIHLPYGTEVDWCRNALAAGGCKVEHDGVRVGTANPVIVPAAQALAIVPEGMRRMDRLMAVESYLRMDITRTQPEPASR